MITWNPVHNSPENIESKSIVHNIDAVEISMFPKKELGNINDVDDVRDNHRVT